MEDLAAVMSRQVIPQLREYFFDQIKQSRQYTPPSSPNISPFIDSRGKPVMEALMNSDNYRALYGAD